MWYFQLFLLKFVLDIPGPLWLGVNFRRLVSLTVLKVQGHSTSSMATQIWVETVITSSHREAKIWMEPGSVILQNPSLKGYYRTYNTYTNIFCRKCCSLSWSFLGKTWEAIDLKDLFIILKSKNSYLCCCFVCLVLL